MKSINKFVTFLVAAAAAFAVMLGLAAGASAENKQNDIRDVTITFPDKGTVNPGLHGMVIEPNVLNDGNKSSPKCVTGGIIAVGAAGENQIAHSAIIGKC